MIGIQVTLFEIEGFKIKKTAQVEDTFDVQKGYTKDELFKLYQKARAKLGVTKFGDETKND